jgi:hypothetical protein
MNKATLLLVLALPLVGCATQTRSTMLGGAIGAGTGAVLGGIVAPGGKNGEYRTRNVIVGTAVGGMAGMVTGALIGDKIEKEKQEAFKNGQATRAKAPPPGSPPSLQSAKVDARWVEGRIMGNRYVEGHWEYIIIEPARWEDN